MRGGWQTDLNTVLLVAILAGMTVFGFLFYEQRQTMIKTQGAVHHLLNRDKDVTGFIFRQQIVNRALLDNARG